MNSPRSEWNDRALDQLDGRVENLERDVDGLREHVDRRLSERQPNQMRWSTFLLTVMGTIVVPLIGVIITGYFMLRAAGL
jgi:hypothetical protein